MGGRPVNKKQNIVHLLAKTQRFGKSMFKEDSFRTHGGTSQETSNSRKSNGPAPHSGYRPTDPGGRRWALRRLAQPGHRRYINITHARRHHERIVDLFNIGPQGSNWPNHKIVGALKNIQATQ
ncbi:hypothetical protein [Nonomuraea sp. NEAU-A123]|uniref:hypothetical protein n=1 Tax=Nonomuraea sp. NEAU-A123 TaxID=2839649 RepID=UPI001BE45B0A|nr:hypothetical protein [Nonomuraea sp. NEAU-A123]MBT2231387.1 hypothetical protein [Nonomuraea sp. NEAU-A123]